MKSEVSLFNFHSKEIRVVAKDGEPWFVTADVCRALNIQIQNNGKPNVAAAVRQFDDHEKGMLKIHTLGGTQRVSCVSESGLYKLIMRSNKKEAKEFQNWVTQTVLPAIRKDGAYVIGEEKVSTGELSEDELLLRAFEVLRKKTERLTKERDEVQGVIDAHLTYLTVDEWRALHHAYLSHSQKVRLGQVASEICRLEGVTRRTQERTLHWRGVEQKVRINEYRADILDRASRVVNLGIEKPLVPHAA